MKAPGDRLREARLNAGFPTAAEMARRFGLHPQNVRDHEAGRRGISADWAATYAKALRVDAAWLLYGLEQSPNREGLGADEISGIDLARNIPVIGEVRAGAWAEVVESAESAEGYVAVNLPEYSRATLFALRVEGRSMDLIYPSGTIVIVCPAAEAGVRDGDIVVVRRRKGSLAETTLKQVAQEGDGVSLWPRSTDPAYQLPIRLETVRDADEGPEIIGVVVGHQARAVRSGPLINL